MSKPHGGKKNQTIEKSTKFHKSRSGGRNSCAITPNLFFGDFLGPGGHFEVYRARFGWIVLELGPLEGGLILGLGEYAPLRSV